MNRFVGKSVQKIDALSLATGEAKFVDDYTLPGTTYAKIMTSPHAHAKIIEIDTSQAEKIEGVIDILCYKNVKRVLHTTAGQGFPEPSPYDTVMFDTKVRYAGDRVAAVLADSIETAEQAISRIKVHYEMLPALLDYEKALEPDAPIIHEEPDKYSPIHAPYEPQKNLAAHVAFEHGDVNAGFKEAEQIFEHTYYTGYASHCMLEPHSVFTYLDEQNRLVMVTSTQVPFHVRRICSKVL